MTAAGTAGTRVALRRETLSALCGSGYVADGALSVTTKQDCRISSIALWMRTADRYFGRRRRGRVWFASLSPMRWRRA